MVRLAAWCAAYFVAIQFATMLFPESSGVINTLWPASGIAISALLTLPRRNWLSMGGAFAAVGFLTNVLLVHRPVLAAFGFAVANMVEALGCAHVLRRQNGEACNFSRVRDVVALLGASALVNGVSAIIGAGTAAVVGQREFWPFYRMWWVSNGLGILLVTPVILSWRGAFRHWDDVRRMLTSEAVAFWLIWGATSWLTFFDAGRASIVQPSPYLLTVLLSWPALRHGARTVSLALVMMGALAVSSPAMDIGVWPLGGETHEDRVLLLQFYLSISTVMGLLIAASHQQARSAGRVAREEQQRLKALSDRIPDGMVYQVARQADGTMRFLHVSEGVERVDGVSAAAAMRDPAQLYGLVLEEDRAALAKAEAESERAMSTFSSTFRIRRPDGTIRWLQNTSAPRRLDDGSVVWDGLQLDITDRKNEEAERERLQAQLAQSQKMESVGRLAGGVAHDFNNMLGVILGHAELALEQIDLDNKVRPDIVALQDAAQRSADLTKQLLAFARRQTVTPLVLDLNTTVESLLKMLSRVIGENVKLDWRPGTGVALVKIDPAQVDQILANLCVNAKDAISGGGAITIMTSNVTLDAAACAGLTGVQPGDHVLLEVRDSGAGLSAEAREHLFEPFFTTKEKGKGTGLGLATVFGIVKQNGGHIAIESEPGAGTAVRIMLPRVEGVAVAPKAAPVEAVPDGNGETILLVEDEESLLELGAEMLDRLGYEALSAGTPREALALAAEHGSRIKLILTDVVMPEMDGLELASHLATLLPGTPCLFTSGYTADVTATHGVLDEGLQFIQKPFSMQVLARRIRAALKPAPDRPPA